MSIHLEKLIHEFNQWHEKVNRGRVPKRLKQQVINLCHQHTPETLAHALGLKKATVKQWQRRARAANTTLPNSVDFVALTPPQPISTKPSPEILTFTFELPNDMKLSWTGQNVKNLVELASSLVKGLRP